MTTLDIHPTPTPRGPGALGRGRALTAAETRLLLRNRTAVGNSVLAPLLLVAAVWAIDPGGEFNSGLVVTAIGITLVLTTYYNLVITFVARREDLVLQRMRTGELTDAEILLGSAVPTLLVTVAQIAVAAAGAAAIGDWSAPVDVVLPVLAVLGGAALMVLLAAVSTSFTRTAESAQISTMPFVIIATVLSGLYFPLTVFPDAVSTVARLLPLTPVLELARLGLLGEAWDGTAVDAAGAWAQAPLPLAVLAAWLVAGAAVARRVFRWAPRR
jgi:ABC-2 type transport system permease protein